MPEVGVASLLYLIGFVIMILGMLILVIGSLSGGRETRRGEVGGIILIGPFPIIFGSSSRIMRIMMFASIILVVIVILTAILPHIMG